MAAFDTTISSRFFIAKNLTQWRQFFFVFERKLKKISFNQWQFSVRFMLVVCLSFNAAKLFLLLLPSLIIPAASVIPSAASHPEETHVAAINNSTVDIEQLKLLQLFGKVGAEKKEASVVDIESAETKLNLVLMGVVASNVEKMGRAIISTGSQQDVYAVGETLLMGETLPMAETLPLGEGIIIVKVMRDRVIISNNGRYESLFLYGPDAKVVNAVANVSLAPQSSEMAQWLADHAEPEGGPPQTEALQAEAIIAANKRSQNNAANTITTTVAINALPRTPEMMQWLEDHADSQGDMQTESQTESQ